MRRLPPVASIQALVAVARLGSLKAAAESLALSSPALTRRIQSLEQFVGTSLFERQHNGMHLNPTGLHFFEEIAPHIDAMADAIERISEAKLGMHLRIAVPSLFAAQRLVPALPSLRRRHPALQIDLDTLPNRLARLGDQVDAAIVITDKVDERFYARKLQIGRVVVIGARNLTKGPDAIRLPADVARVPVLIHRDMPEAFDHWRRAVGLPSLEPAAISYFDAGQLILDSAAEGLGIAFMLDSHMNASTDRRLVQIFEETVESVYSYWFACTPDAFRRRSVRAFHDWLFDEFKLTGRDEAADGLPTSPRRSLIT